MQKQEKTNIMLITDYVVVMYAFSSELFIFYDIYLCVYVFAW